MSKKLKYERELPNPGAERSETSYGYVHKLVGEKILGSDKNYSEQKYWLKFLG